MIIMMIMMTMIQAFIQCHFQKGNGALQYIRECVKN